jgi:hypothetical protein
MALPKVDLNQGLRGPIETMKEFTKEPSRTETIKTNKVKTPIEENKGKLINTKA